MSGIKNVQKEGSKDTKHQDKSQKGFFGNFDFCGLCKTNTEENPHPLKCQRTDTQKMYSDCSSAIEDNKKQRTHYENRYHFDCDTDSTIIHQQEQTKINNQNKKSQQIMSSKNNSQNKDKQIPSQRESRTVYQDEESSSQKSDSTIEVVKNNVGQSNMNKLQQNSNHYEIVQQSNVYSQNSNSSYGSLRSKDPKNIEIQRVIKAKYNLEEDWVRHLTNVNIEKETEEFDGKKFEFKFSLGYKNYKLYSIKIESSDIESQKKIREFSKLKKQIEKSDTNTSAQVLFSDDEEYSIYYFIILEKFEVQVQPFQHKQFL